MKVELQAGTIQLRPQELLKITDGAGSTICTRQGALWITEQDLAHDVVLEQGDCHELRNPGLALVSALADETVFNLDIRSKSCIHRRVWHLGHRRRDHGCDRTE